MHSKCQKSITHKKWIIKHALKIVRINHTLKIRVGHIKIKHALKISKINHVLKIRINHTKNQTCTKNIKN